MSLQHVPAATSEVHLWQRSGNQRQAWAAFPCRGHSLGPPPGRGHFLFAAHVAQGGPASPATQPDGGAAHQRAGPRALRWSRDGHTVKLCQRNATWGPEAREAPPSGLAKPGAATHLLATPGPGHQGRRLGWTSVYNPGAVARSPDTSWAPLTPAAAGTGSRVRPEASQLPDLLCDPNPGIALLQASVSSRL